MICFKNSHHLLEKFEARILGLPLLVLWIVAMLANDDDSVHRERVASTTQRLRDRGINLEAMLGCSRLAEITLWSLVDIQRDDLDPWLMPCSLPWIADEESVAHMLSVRQIFPDGRNDCDALGSDFLTGCRSRNPPRQGTHRAQKTASCQHRGSPEC